MHGWQANTQRTCAPPVVLGLCPKLKYHPLCGWIFIVSRKRGDEAVDKRVVEDVDPYETTFGGVTLRGDSRRLTEENVCEKTRFAHKNNKIAMRKRAF